MDIHNEFLQSLSDSPFVVILIVNYNGTEDTIECLYSLQNITYTNYRIIVVDNGSKLNEIPRFSTLFPDVIFIRSSVNTGFTGGNNIGLTEAFKLNPDYIFFLNNDTVVSNKSLNYLVSHMEFNPDVGMAGPLNCYYHQKNIISFGGGFINRNNGIVKFINKDLHINSIDLSPFECSFIEGSAMLARTWIIKEIDGFYDGYFLTSEESELCVRISDLGYKLSIIPSSLVWHKVSKSMGKESELSSYFIFRNKLWFIKRNSKFTLSIDLAILIRYYLVCLLSYYFKKKNPSAAKGLLLGVLDFFKGVQGPGRYR